jgi:uncharacterized YccA/Bax inhibitor family protein
MTRTGTLVKIAWLLFVLSSVAAWSWRLAETNPSSAWALSLGASFAGFIVAMVIIFKKPNAFLVTLYAALQGLLIGAISFVFGSQYQGIVTQAVLFTISITFGMLFLYGFKLVTVTQKLRSMILIATLGILFFYLFSFIISLFSSSFADFVYTGTSGIIIAAIIVVIAALNLLLDFDFIDKGVDHELPKQFEWYGAFGIMVTLIWLYFSILRLLAASRR